MNPRFSVLTLLTFTLAAGCGGESSSDAAQFGVDLVMSQAVADEVGTFQLVVLPNGRQRVCTDIQKLCLKQQVKQDEALVLRDAQGAEGRALRFPANLAGGVQDVSVEVPVGRDYVLVIEAISRAAPPRFLGSSCNYLPEVNAGRNDPVLAAPMALNAVDCDPTFAP